MIKTPNILIQVVHKYVILLVLIGKDYWLLDFQASLQAGKHKSKIGYIQGSFRAIHILQQRSIASLTTSSQLTKSGFFIAISNSLEVSLLVDLLMSRWFSYLDPKDSSTLASVFDRTNSQCLQMINCKIYSISFL